MYSIYEVETNDTLSSVANKVGISIDELASINGIMAGTILTPGQLIIVPNKTNENEYFKKKDTWRFDSHVSPSMLVMHGVFAVRNPFSRATRAGG